MMAGIKDLGVQGETVRRYSVACTKRIACGKCMACLLAIFNLYIMT